MVTRPPITTGKWIMLVRARPRRTVNKVSTSPFLVLAKSKFGKALKEFQAGARIETRIPTGPTIGGDCGAAAAGEYNRCAL
jgi:hypothetical protein